MDIRITPTRLSGEIAPPPSKSMAHRLIITAALGSGVSTVRNVSFSQDIEATLRCMEALGAVWEQEGEDVLHIRGIGNTPITAGSDLPRFDCGESGSTLRFLIPIALAVAGGGVFTGRGRLMERPLKPYFDICEEKDMKKLSAILIAVILTFSLVLLVSCGDKDKDNKKPHPDGSIDFPIVDYTPNE